MEENLEQQLLIRGRSFATFSTIEKALAGRMLCRLLYRISNTIIVWPSQQAKLKNKNSYLYKGEIPVKRGRF